MTNTITKITYDWNDYKVWEGYTAWTWISIDANNEISNSWVTSFNWSTGTVTYTAPVTSVNGSTWAVTVQAQHSTLSLTLASADWSGNTITVTATWVTASNTVIISPAPSSFTNYTNAKIYCSSQASNSLTFTCDTEPSNDITVNVVILD